MLRFFRATSLCEGMSFLLILSVTIGIVPREFVYSIGITHGVLFLAYFVMSLLTSHKQGWSVIVWLMVLLAAIVPFAFIAVEMFMQRELQKDEVSA